MAYAKFDPNKSVMLATAIKYNGNVVAIADAMNVGRTTIYEYFKRNPEGKEIIDLVRGLNDEVLLDAAEHVFRYNVLNYKSSPGLAQRAAEKVIDKKGYMRGWKTQDDSIQKSPNDKEFDAVSAYANLSTTITIKDEEIQKLKDELNALKPQTDQIICGSNEEIQYMDRSGKVRENILEHPEIN